MAENCAPMFELHSGGNLHIFEIQVFQMDEMGNKMDSFSLSIGNEMTRQLLTFLLLQFCMPVFCIFN